MISKRMNSIDVLRFFAAFAVVGIHYPLFGLNIITPMCRAAVPVFFMISGYFCLNNTPQKQAKKIKHILFLTIAASAFYFIASFVSNFLSHNVGDFVNDNFSLKAIIELFVFNDAKFGTHLWFLFALLYCLIIDYFVSKIKINKKLMVAIIIVLLLCDVILGKYGLLLWNNTVNYIYTRNFIFVGLPYFYIGKLIKDIEPDKIKINNTLLVIMTVLFSATSMIVSYLFRIYKESSPMLKDLETREQFISTTLLALSVFIIVHKNPLNNPPKIINLIAAWGKKYSLMIYIIHPLFLNISTKLAKHIGGIVLSTYKVSATILIFACSLIFAIIYYKIKDLILLRKH